MSYHDTSCYRNGNDCICKRSTMHSYTGPSGLSYHLSAEGSVTGGVHFRKNNTMMSLSMRDVLFLAALHKRNHLTSLAEASGAEDLIDLAENGTDFEVLGLPVED